MAPTEIPQRILLVDDSPANLRLLSQILTENGYSVRAVTSGQHALVSAEMDPPDMILLDIRMPGMDGYEVCQQLKAERQTEEIPVLFISALDEIEDKMRAFSAGGVDYITKPFQVEEVLARVRTHLSLRQLQRGLQEANQRMERELALAASVQASFLPGTLPQVPGWQLAVLLLPARLTSGDFYDAIRLPNGRLGILIADVVDKGVGAALYMAMSSALLRASLSEHPDRPDLVCQSVSERLLAYTGAGQFVTLFLGILEPASGRLSYCNAGHNPPVCLRSDPPGQVQLLTGTGPALGVMEGFTWELASLCLRRPTLGPAESCGFGRGAAEYTIIEGDTIIEDGRFPSDTVPRDKCRGGGDVLILYTDGITDAQNPAGEFYGLDRLLEVIRNEGAGREAAAAEPPLGLRRTPQPQCSSPRGSGALWAERMRDAILQDVRRFANGACLVDDIALMVLAPESE